MAKKSTQVAIVFGLSLAVFTLTLDRYTEFSCWVANRIACHLDPPFRFAVNGDELLVFPLACPDQPVAAWLANDLMALQINLVVLPVLVVATPASRRSRVWLLLAGLPLFFLLQVVHLLVGSGIGSRQGPIAQIVDGNIILLHILLPIVAWAVLTWNHWIPQLAQTQAPE